MKAILLAVCPFRPQMKTNLKNFAHFTKAQIKGIFVFTSLGLLFFAAPKIMSKLASKEATDFSEYEKEISSFESALEKEAARQPKKKQAPSIPNRLLFNFDPNTITKEKLVELGLSPAVANTLVNFRNKGFKFRKKEDLQKVYGLKEADVKITPPKKLSFPKAPNKTKKIPKKKELTPFKFNPNEADKTTFLSLGLSNKVAQTILNYRNSGGQFRQKEDFEKMYGLSEADYLILAKRIIPTTTPQSFSTVASIKIDINNSSMEDWKQLKGIGEITAKRIINFREKLGGFISIDQLKMTYNVADSVIDKVAHQLIVSPIPNKIPINTISAEALKLHPYIKKKQAYLLVNYRTNHGKYTHISDLEKVKALPPDFIKRIAPYLSFE